MIGLTFLVLIPILIDSSTDASQIVYSVICWIPYALAAKRIDVAIVQNLMKHKHSEKLKFIDLVIYIFIFMSSGSLILMNFWLYAPESWETLADPNLNAIEVWLRFTATSILVATGGEFTALKPQWWYSEIIVALMAFIYFVTFILLVGAFALPFVYDTTKKEDEDMEKEESSIATTARTHKQSEPKLNLSFSMFRN